MRDAPDTAQPLLRVSGLARRFQIDAPAAVRDASFELRRGELLALLGPSGCGKTTTLRMIGGFERPDAGQVMLNGQDITHLAPEKRGIGFVFQDYALFPHLSVVENVRFGLRHQSRETGLTRAHAMLELVGLTEMARRRPHELSGGQQQRVALARTLAVGPPLVLMDEPFSNLDATKRVETRQEVRALLAKTGASAILVTHDQEEALALADRVAVMESGRIHQLGTPEEVHANPATEFVASFIGRSNILPGQAGGAMARTDLGDLSLSQPRQGQIRLAIRPEQIRLTPDGTAGAQIVGREFRGHDQLYWVQQGARTLLVISGPTQHIAIGTPVRIEIGETVTPLPD